LTPCAFRFTMSMVNEGMRVGPKANSASYGGVNC
jgi:hypothetical protein